MLEVAEDVPGVTVRNSNRLPLNRDCAQFAEVELSRVDTRYGVGLKRGLRDRRPG